jgi:hypothetical protein
MHRTAIVPFVVSSAMSSRMTKPQREEKRE